MLTFGSYAPLVTPLRTDGSLDGDGLRRLVGHVLDGGCAGVLALGSAGENVTLGRSVRAAALAEVAAAVVPRGQLLVGVVQCSLGEAVDDATAAADAGASAVVATPPYYGPLDEVAVERFYTQLAERSPLPVLGYHIPSFTGVPVPPRVIGRLAADGVLAGVKDSGRDLEYLQQVLDAVSGFPDVAVFTGTDSLILPAVQLGAVGAISIAANVVPGWTSSLCRAAADGETSRALSLQHRLSRVAFALRAGTFPAGTKAALAMLDVCAATTAEPARPLGEADLRRLTHALAAEGVLPGPAERHDISESRSA